MPAAHISRSVSPASRASSSASAQYAPTVTNGAELFTAMYASSPAARAASRNSSARGRGGCRPARRVCNMVRSSLVSPTSSRGPRPS